MSRLLLIIAGSLWIAFSSCQQKEKDLTKEEVLAFAKEVEKSIDKRDGTILDERFDKKSLIEKADFGNSKDVKSIEASLRSSLNLGSKIVSGLSKKGSYTFIKQYIKNNIHHVLFRLYDNRMLNYHDFELKRVNGKVKIADVFIYVAGENFSSLLKDMYNHYHDELGDLSEKVSTQWEKDVPKMRVLVDQGRYQEAEDIYKTIPEKIKNSKILQVTHLMICAGLTDEEYTKAVAEYESIYPNEPNMQLLMVDAYIVRKNYTKALNAVNELDRMIDKDPMLDYYRALCYTLMKDDAKRLEYLEKAISNLPEFEDGLLELIIDYLQLKEFEKARPLIERFKSRSSFDQATLNLFLDQYPGYNEKYGDR